MAVGSPIVPSGPRARFPAPSLLAFLSHSGTFLSSGWCSAGVNRNFRSNESLVSAKPSGGTAAISTIRLEVVMEAIVPFLLVVGVGIAWNVFCVMWLARRILPNFWFERAIAEMGQSMGVTATGLLLLRAVDPEQETVAASAFGYKQLLHEPFMGGGLWTSTAVLIVARQGGLFVVGISVFAIAAWLLVWRVFLKGREE